MVEATGLGPVQCGFESLNGYEHSLSVYDGSMMPKIIGLTEATMSGRLVLEREESQYGLRLIQLSDRFRVAKPVPRRSGSRTVNPVYIVQSGFDTLRWHLLVTR